jgi:hypothetical protein
MCHNVKEEDDGGRSHEAHGEIGAARVATAVLAKAGGPGSVDGNL